MSGQEQPPEQQQSLYRRHRPRTFAEIVGQEAVVRTLRNAVQRGKVHHAYLFVGSRGTGKTSMAKILAKSLNCERGPTSSPCKVCESCRAIHDATSIDVIELDAPKPWETADWLVKFLKGRGRVIKKDAAEALIEAVGTDLRDIATSAEQLTMATTGTIGVDTVNKLFRGMESALYTFLDVLLQRDRAAALRHLGALMRAGEHPLVIMQALSKQFRAIAAARDAGRTPAAALAKELGVATGYVNRSYRHGRNFDAGEIRRAFRLLADADLALKGGLLGEDNPPELVMELLVSEIAGEGRMAAARRR